MTETKPIVGPGEQGDRLREALIEAMTYLFCNCHVRCSECKHDFVVYGAGVSKPTLDALKAKADAALAAYEEGGGLRERLQALCESLVGDWGVSHYGRVEPFSEEQRRTRTQVAELIYAAMTSQELYEKLWSSQSAETIHERGGGGYDEIKAMAKRFYEQERERERALAAAATKPTV